MTDNRALWELVEKWREDGMDMIHKPSVLVRIECREHADELAAILDRPVVVGGWLPIESAPDDCGPVLVFAPHDEGGMRVFIEYREGGVWIDHSNTYEHFIAVGGTNAAGPDCVCTGPSETSPYTHWMPIPAEPETLESMVRGKS